MERKRHTIGCAVEVDGPEHKSEVDDPVDKYMYRRSGIVVLRVKNMDEDDALKALNAIAKLELWNDRRKRIGVKRTKAERRRDKMSGVSIAADRELLGIDEEPNSK